MDEKQLIRASKRLARQLRHAPGEIGLVPREGGWVPVDDLLAAPRRHGTPSSRAELDEIVSRNDKRRFGFDETGTLIRANQGHSIPVELDLPEAVPPDVLFHGTTAAAIPAIRREGLRPMRRRHRFFVSANGVWLVEAVPPTYPT